MLKSGLFGEPRVGEIREVDGRSVQARDRHRLTVLLDDSVPELIGVLHAVLDRPNQPWIDKDRTPGLAANAFPKILKTRLEQVRRHAMPARKGVSICRPKLETHNRNS